MGSELTTKSTLVTEDAPQEQQLVTASQQDFSSMSAGELLDAVSRNPLSAGDIVRARPVEAGQLILLAKQNKQSQAAMLLTSALRAGFLHGTPVLRDMLYRSVLRVQGPGASEVHAIIKSLVATGGGFNPPDIPLVGAIKIEDPRISALNRAERDPAWATFTANFFDRPDAAAAQLLEEAQKHPAEFENHVACLPELLHSSPAAARAFGLAVMALRGPKATELNLRVLSAVHSVIGVDIRMMNRGINDMKAGGPRARAERLVPLMAALMSQERNAAALVRLERLKKPVPGSGYSMSAMMKDALWKRWSDDVTNQVRSSFSAGGGALLAGSLTADAGSRKARAMDAGKFIGEAACAEKVNEKRDGEGLAADALNAASDFLPSPYKYGVKGASKALDAMSEAPAPTWTTASVDDLMRSVYTRVHPEAATTDFDDADADKRYGEMTQWTTAAGSELKTAMGECK